MMRVDPTVVGGGNVYIYIYIVGGKSQKSVWWNDEIKAAVRRKEAAWKAASNEETKERYMEAYKEEKEKVKML